MFNNGRRNMDVYWIDCYSKLMYYNFQSIKLMSSGLFQLYEIDTSYRYIYFQERLKKVYSIN